MARGIQAEGDRGMITALEQLEDFEEAYRKWFTWDFRSEDREPRPEQYHLITPGELFAANCIKHKVKREVDAKRERGS